MVSVIIKGGVGRKDGWMVEGRPEAAMFVRVDMIQPITAVGLRIDIPKVPNTLSTDLRRGGGCLLVMTAEAF